MSPFRSQRAVKVFLVIYQNTLMTVSPNPIALEEVLRSKTIAAYNFDYDKLMPTNNVISVQLLKLVKGKIRNRCLC